MLSDLLFTLLTNPYSGIFRRRYWEDIRIQLVLVLESFLTACAFLDIITKIRSISIFLLFLLTRPSLPSS